jgi:hypothetical protein
MIRMITLSLDAITDAANDGTGSAAAIMRKVRHSRHMSLPVAILPCLISILQELGCGHGARVGLLNLQSVL